jgi:hypothetical protein
MASGREIAHIEDRVAGLFLFVNKQKTGILTEIPHYQAYETEKLV